MDGHRANPVNLFAGALGMVINNVIFLAGLWGMLFAGKPKNAELLFYYIALTAVVMTSWGSVNFFFGGLRSLGDLITDGMLEPMLATPRDPIYLAAISKSHPIALGDLLMGLLGLTAVFFQFSPVMGYKCLFASALSSLAFAGLFIFAGSISFFVSRGNQVGHLLIELTVSMSTYPTGKMFTGPERILLLLTPAAATAVLPVDAVEKAGTKFFLIALLAAVGFFIFSVLIFRIGLSRYRSVSLIGIQR